MLNVCKHLLSVNDHKTIHHPVIIITKSHVLSQTEGITNFTGFSRLIADLVWFSGFDPEMVS